MNHTERGLTGQQPQQPIVNTGLPEAQSKYCPGCGKRIHINAFTCPSCGLKQKSLHGSEKSPSLAAILSFLFVGLGQIYCGRIKRGLAFIGLYLLSFFLLIFLIGIILLPIVYIYNIYDAYELAKKINEGEITPSA